jgi:hypothetical protein
LKANGIIINNSFFYSQVEWFVAVNTTVEKFDVSLYKVGSAYDGRLEREKGVDEQRAVGFFSDSSYGRKSIVHGRDYSDYG